MPWPIASLASSGISAFSSVFERSWSRKACRVLQNRPTRGLAAFNAPPELALGSDNEVLVERIGVSGDFYPLAAAGNYRKDGASSRHHPHIVLQLRHVFLGRGFFRERPGQHELGLKDRACGFNPAIQRNRHPSQRWMPDLPLDIGEDLPTISLIPAPIQVLS